MLKYITLDTYVQKIKLELSKKSLYTWEHSERVAKYAVLIAKEFYSEKDLKLIEMAGKMHDIGKIYIPSSILEKDSKLTDEEYEEIKKHPLYSLEYLKKLLSTSPLSNKHLQYILDSAAYHHERYDGKGYPFGLKGTDIPLIGRIMAVADSFDAMYSKRPYNSPMTLDSCLKEIERCAGTQFDPVIASVFIRFMSEREDIALA